MNLLEILEPKHFLTEDLPAYLLTFGRFQTERAALILMRFFQARGRGWEPFTYEQVDFFWRGDAVCIPYSFKGLDTGGFILYRESTKDYVITERFLKEINRPSYRLNWVKGGGKTCDSETP